MNGKPPNDEVGASVDHRPLLIKDMFLLMRLHDVVLLHLLQRVRASRLVADLYLSTFTRHLHHLHHNPASSRPRSHVLITTQRSASALLDAVSKLSTVWSGGAVGMALD